MDLSYLARYFEEDDYQNEGNEDEEPDKGCEDFDGVEDGGLLVGEPGEPIEGIVTYGETESLHASPVDAKESLNAHVGLVLLNLNRHPSLHSWHDKYLPDRHIPTI